MGIDLNLSVYTAIGRYPSPLTKLSHHARKQPSSLCNAKQSMFLCYYCCCSTLTPSRSLSEPVQDSVYRPESSQDKISLAHRSTGRTLLLWRCSSLPVYANTSESVGSNKVYSLQLSRTFCRQGKYARTRFISVGAILDKQSHNNRNARATSSRRGKGGRGVISALV